MASFWSTYADQLGSALKLNDGEFEAIKGRRLGWEGAELIINLTYQGNTKLEDVVPALTNFTALYLPRFIDAYQEVLRRYGTSFTSMGVKTVAVCLTSQPLLSRWARENDGLGLITTVAECYLAGLFPLDLTDSSTSIFAVQVVRTMEDLLKVIWVVARALPLPPSPSTNFFAISPDLRNRLQARLVADSIGFEFYRTTHETTMTPDIEQRVDAILPLLAVVRRFVESETAEDWRRYESSRPVGTWWNCQWSYEAGTDGCVKGKEGDKMMACGRCKAVRYCSVDHQRAHWKKHRPFCQTPNW